MSIQAEKLLSRLQNEGEIIELVPTNPRLPTLFSWTSGIPGVRTAIRQLRYLVMLMKTVRHSDVVHHMAASGASFYLGCIPVTLVSALFKKRLLLNYRGGQAAEFLARHQLIAIPFLRLANKIVVPSEFLRSVFAIYGFDAEILPNIADTELFQFRARRTLQPRLICTRHLEPMYNPECVIRAFRRVQTKFPTATLGMVGNGSQRQQLEALVNQLQLRGVTFHGFVPPAKLGAVYDKYDIFVNASLVDNFPGSLVDAACCGLPIVTSKAGGIPFMIKDRVNGRLTDLDSDEQIAECVTELVNHPEHASSLIAAARTWAQEYSWENVYPQLRRLYNGNNQASDPIRNVSGGELRGVSR